MESLQVRWIIESGILSYTDNLIKYLKDNNIYHKEINYQEVISPICQLAKDMYCEANIDW